MHLRIKHKFVIFVENDALYWSSSNANINVLIQHFREIRYPDSVVYCVSIRRIDFVSLCGLRSLTPQSLPQTFTVAFRRELLEKTVSIR